MAFGASVLPHVEIEARLKALLNVLGDGDAIPLAAIAERIRSLVSLEPSGLTSQALTNKIRALIEPIFPDFVARERELSSRTENGWAVAAVRTLHRLGEIKRNSENRYLATPARLINPSPDCEIVLIIGGEPRQVIESRFNTKVSVFASSRFVTRNSLSEELRADPTRWQSLTDWLGVEERALDLWTHATINTLTEGGHPGRPIAATSIDVYFPDQEWSKWRPLATLNSVPPGVRLCRCAFEHQTYPKRFFLATLVRRPNEITVEKSLMIDSQAGTRLMYGLDLIYGEPRKVEATLEGDAIQIIRPPQLPFPEYRIYSLAVRAIAPNGVRTVSFATDLSDTISKTLSNFGLTLCVTSERKSENGS